jgi:hypothetical protein
MPIPEPEILYELLNRVIDIVVATPLTITEASPGSAGAASGAGSEVVVEVVEVVEELGDVVVA